MKLPQGTPLMQPGLLLGQEDLQESYRNLSHQQFTGYLQIHLNPAQSGYVFFTQGALVRAFLLDSQGDAKMQTPERLFARVGQERISCSSFVLTPPMAHVLSLAFGFEDFSDWKTVFAQDKQTGLAWFDDQAVLFDKGEPVQAVLTQSYGQVACGRESLAQLLQRDRASICHCQTGIGLEQRVKRLHADLDRTREVRLKSVSGFFATKDSLKIDPELAQSWGVKGTFSLVLEDLEGRRVGMLKTMVGCKKPQVVEIPLKVMQDWGLQEDQCLLAYPHGD